MARILYSTCGEGRGHATRVRAVIEALRDEHEFAVLASGDAFSLLAPIYAGSRVRVHRIAGLRFHYRADGRLALGKTARAAGGYLHRFSSLLSVVDSFVDREQPDLVITDFEPALPRVARRRGIPFVSIDHQHFLVAYDLSGLPLRLRWHASIMGAGVRLWHQGAMRTLISSFYFPPLRRRHQGAVQQVGVLLRPEVLEAPRRDGTHLVAYCRRFAGRRVLEALACTGREVRVYGLGAAPSSGHLSFHEVHPVRFVEDLASCAALISTAGNQLVGEALALGKPVFVMPEARNYEQYINAHFVRQAGVGDWVDMERVTASHLRRFLFEIDAHRARIDPSRMNGLPEVVASLRNLLAGLTPHPHHPARSTRSPHLPA